MSPARITNDPFPPTSPGTLFRLGAGGAPLTVILDNDALIVRDAASSPRGRWHLALRGDELLMSAQTEPGSNTGEVRSDIEGDVMDGATGSHVAGEVPGPFLLAALEALFIAEPGRRSVLLQLPQRLAQAACTRGIAVPDEGGMLRVHRDMFHQLPGPWLRGTPSAGFPLRHVFTQGRRHPLRPPKPQGTVYEREIPWLRQTLRLRTLREDDLPAFNRWMNDPVVARFWQEEGDLTRHRAYLHALDQDPRVLPLIACLEDVPFAYFEVYWAKEDRIAPFYDADDFDRGWHVLVGEPAFRGRDFLTAWMPSISHYLFLDDPRTQRIVIEPRADNDKMIRSLSRCGYALLKEFDFPHKRAMLGALSRERFFGEALWLPRP